MASGDSSPGGATVAELSAMATAVAMPSTDTTGAAILICAAPITMVAIAMPTPIAGTTGTGTPTTAMFRGCTSPPDSMAGPTIPGPRQLRLAGVGVGLLGTDIMAITSILIRFTPRRHSG